MISLRKAVGVLDDLAQADIDMKRIRNIDDFKVYEGWQERIGDGLYQTFLFKMKETPVDRSAKPFIDGAMSRILRYIDKQ